MKVLKNKNNMVILGNGKWFYLISYNSVVAKICNTFDLKRVNEEQDYGLFLSVNWDYSQTTLKQVYEFIEDYATQDDYNGNTIAYGLGLVKNKHTYIKDLIDKGFIRLVKEEDM